MKKIFSAILSFFIVSYMAVPVFAANVSYLDNELPDFVPADDEINQEVIDKYGISSTAEFGNEVIIIPMGPSTNGEYIESQNDNQDEDIEGYVHDGHVIPDNVIDNDAPQLYHFSLTPHTHEVINLKKSSGKWKKPVTSYADQGFEISKEYNKSVVINASLNLNGGISKKTAEASIGASIGGSYTRGSSETYTAKVPKGYKGRIVYYYDCTTYKFTNKTTYVWQNTTPPLKTYEYNACSAQGAPRNGYFGLELIKR